MVFPVSSYFLCEAIVALRPAPDGSPAIITLPSGAVLKLQCEEAVSGLVDCLWEGETVSLFIQDLRKRAKLLSSTSVYGKLTFMIVTPSLCL
jgi:hypothetical protein